MSAAEVLAELAHDGTAGKGLNAAGLSCADRRPPLPAAAVASVGGRGAAEGERRTLLRMASGSAGGLARALGLLATALEHGAAEALALGREGARAELASLRGALRALDDRELDRVFATIAWAIDRPDFPPSDAREFSRLLEGTAETFARETAR